MRHWFALATIPTFATACSPSAEPEHNVEAGAAMSVSAENSAQNYEIARTGQSFGGTCYSWSDSTDGDADGFPASAILTLTDCVETSGDSTLTVTGSATLTDPDDAAAAFAFSGSLSLERAAAGDGSTTSASYEGTLVGSNNAATFDIAEGSQTARNTSSISAEIGDIDATVTETFYRTTRFTPSTTWDWRTGLVTGTMTISGRSRFDSIAKDTEVDTPAPLQIDPGCLTLIVGGSIRATYDGDVSTAHITVTWDGCGSRSIDYES